MQPAHAPDRLVARPQIEVIGVGKNDLCTEGFEHILRDSLDSPGRAHRHENRRFDGPVRQMHPPPPSAACGCCQNAEVEAHQTILPGGQELP